MPERTNSPIDDSVPFNEPEFEQPEAVPANDFAKFAKNKKRYTELTDYLDSRKNFYKEYLPDGTAIAKLSDADAGAWWKCAATIIREMELLKRMIDENKKSADMQKEANA